MNHVRDLFGFEPHSNMPAWQCQCCLCTVRGKRRVLEGGLSACSTCYQARHKALRANLTLAVHRSRVSSPSNRVRCGRGLFTLAEIKEGDLITRFEGVVHEDEKRCGAYTVHLFQGMVLDVTPKPFGRRNPLALGAFVNAAPHPSQKNAEIRVSGRRDAWSCVLRATRDIASNEEILISYGTLYKKRKSYLVTQETSDSSV